MATVPKIWNHGEFPTAAEMQKYSDALDELESTLLPYNNNPVILKLDPRNEANSHRDDEVDFTPEDMMFVLVHTFRYLHFLGEGKIVDPVEGEANGDDVRFSPEDGEEHGILDLDTIDWLYYGKRYEVQRATACFEHWETHHA